MSAIVLFAHGARDPEWARPVQAIRSRMLELEPGLRVDTAYLEFMSPTLPETIDKLAATGTRDILIVPLFMAQSGHTKRDLPALLNAARLRHPSLTLRIATPIGEAPEVVLAIARYACAAAGTALP